MPQALCICHPLHGDCNPKLLTARVETDFVEQHDVKLFHLASMDLRGLVHISKLARRGLRRVEKYPACRSKGSSMLLRRVVDIGFLGANVKVIFLKMKVQKAANLQSFSPGLHKTNRELSSFAALSHSWGKKQVITTTGATLESRRAWCGPNCQKRFKMLF